MHTPLLKIEEHIEFPKVLAAKQLPEKSLKTKQQGRLRSLPQIHQDPNLDKE
jgi:hypothetical protein